MRACPGESVLDALAARDEATAGVRRHVAHCAACRDRIEHMRENDRFLSHAASDLAEAMQIGQNDRRSIRPLPAHDSVPGYRIVEEISRGGQGVVYRAIQTDTRRPAAIKMLLAGAFASDRQVHRFERETELAAGLRHPNIVTIFQSGEAADGGRYVAMELVHGVPLDDHVEDTLGPASGSGKARADAVMRLMVQVARGVGHAHTAGVIHRDIKPSNILVDQSGVPRVLDFGLARSVITATDASMTEGFAGTPAYAAPERLNDQHEHTDARGDVYSLGMMLYRLLTGHAPYPCAGSVAVVARHAAETAPTPPSRHVPRLPLDVQTIVLQCLSKDPQRRYASASALAEDLEDYLAGNPISARRDSATYVLHKLILRNRAASAAVSIVALTVLIAAVGFALLAADLDRSRRNTEAALSNSTVQRARMMAKAGDPQQAEELLWGEAIAAGMTTGDSTLWEGSAKRLRSAWSLAEFYASLPRRMRSRTDTLFHTVGLDPERERVWAIDNSASRWSWSLDGELIERTPALTPWSTTSTASPNGRYVVLHGVLHGERKAQVWDIDQRAAIAPPFASEQSAHFMQVEDEGRVLVRYDGPKPGPFQIWDVRGGVPIARLELKSGVLLDRDAEGRLSLIGSTSSPSSLRVYIARPPHWELHQTVDIPSLFGVNSPNRGVTSLRLSQDGQMLAAAVGNYLLLYDLLADPVSLKQVVAPTVNIGYIMFDSLDRSLIATGQDGVLMTFAVPGLDLLYAHRAGYFHRIATAGDPPLVVVAMGEGDVAVFAATDRPWRTRIPSSQTTQMSIAISPHGRLAWGDAGGTLHIRSAREPHSVISIPAHEGEINAVCWSPDGATLLTTGSDGAIREWAPDGRPLRVVATGLSNYLSARYAPDGRSIAAGDRGGTIRVWRDGRGEPLEYQTGMVRIPMIRFSPDGRRLLCAAENGNGVAAESIVLDLETGVQLYKLLGHGRIIRAVEWSPDGALAITGGDDRALRVWDAASGALLRTIRGLPWGPYELVFHPRGRMLFAIGPGGSIVVIDPHAGVELAQLPVHDRAIFSITLSPDGTTLYTAGQDSWIGITDLDHLLGYIRGNENYWRGAKPAPPLE